MAAPHVRTQIRDYLKLKINEITDFNGNIFFDDPSVKQINKIPCCCIVSQSENITSQIVGHPKLYNRDYEISFIIIIRDKGNIQNDLDNFALLVEEKLGNDKNLNGLVLYHQLTNIDFQFSEEEEDYGIINMNYTFTYRTKENNVKIAL